jgi:hypothetical protein
MIGYKWGRITSCSSKRDTYMAAIRELSPSWTWATHLKLQVTGVGLRARRQLIGERRRNKSAGHSKCNMRNQADFLNPSGTS